MKKLILIILLTVPFIVGCSQTKINNISNTEYEELINNEEDYKIIDVRSLSEYMSGHIKDSINIPLEKLSTIKDIILDKNTKIILYCQSGTRSKQAAELLLNYGYKNIYNLTNGISNSNYKLVK